jgi:hypothetical protein
MERFGHLAVLIPVLHVDRVPRSVDRLVMTTDVDNIHDNFASSYRTKGRRMVARLPPARGYVRWPMRIFLAACALVLVLEPHALYAQSTPASERPIAGLGHAHMDTSCSPGVSADFDRARALEAFTEVAQRDPDCAIAYWGAAKTYDHPFWDPPTRSDESTAGRSRKRVCARRGNLRARGCISPRLLPSTRRAGRAQSRRGIRPTWMRWRPRTRPTQMTRRNCFMG